MFTLILGSIPAAGEVVVLPEGRDPGYCHSVAKAGHGHAVWVELENRMLYTHPIYSVKIDTHGVATATLCYETGNLQNRDDSIWWESWGENNTRIITKDSIIDLSGMDFDIHCFDSNGTKIYHVSKERRAGVALPSYSTCDIIFSGASSADGVYTIQILSDIPRPFFYSLKHICGNTCCLPIILPLWILVQLLKKMEDSW